MTAALAAALVLAALPAGTARYRAELAGEPVGVAELRVACADAGCAIVSDVKLRLPAEAGGGVEVAHAEVEVDHDGRFRDGAVRIARGGTRATPRGIAGAIPSALVEVVLAAEGSGTGSCITFFDEERPAPRRACAHRDGAAIVADIGGVPVRIVPGADGFPREVVVSGRFRYLRDPRAAVPARAPRLAGTRVPGPRDPRDAAAFCGVAAEPRAAPVTGGAALPPPRAAGESCREKTAAWLAAARARGLEGRAAVGVAWDGEAFVWHEWAEVRAGGAWTAVDPSFGELPARGPRFTLARFAVDDAAGREAAGSRILACWGSARVE